MKNYKGVPLSNFPLDLEEPICILAGKIDWELLGKQPFTENYIPMQPSRRLLGLLILEKLTNRCGDILLSDWKRIPYYQYFTGETLFHWELPISAKEIEQCRTQLNDSTINMINKIVDGVII